MKLIAVLFTSLCISTLHCGAEANGFQNLDFESAIVPDLPPGQAGSPISIEMAMPGWSGFLGARLQSEVLYNLGTFGSSALTIHDAHSTFVPLIEGQFTALLLGALDPIDSLNAIDVSLQQTGLVPDSARSLQFKAANTRPLPLGALVVQLNGELLPLTPVSIESEVYTMAADVSSYAGTVAELKFTALGNILGPNPILLDSIVFSPEMVPEPATWLLLLVGLSLGGAWRWAIRRQ